MAAAGLTHRPGGRASGVHGARQACLSAVPAQRITGLPASSLIFAAHCARISATTDFGSEM